MNDGVVVSSIGMRSSARVRASLSHPNAPLMPATSELAGSNPSGGRLKVVFCDCEMATKLTWPFWNGNSDAMPKIEVGAEANSGFSSYRTATCLAVRNRVSGRRNVNCPSS